MLHTALSTWLTWLQLTCSLLGHVGAVKDEPLPKPLVTITIKPDGDVRADAQWMGFTPSGAQLAIRSVRPGAQDATITVLNTDTGKRVASTVIKMGGVRECGRSLSCGISPGGDWIAYVEARRIKFLTIPPHESAPPRGGDVIISETDTSPCADLWLDEKGRVAYIARRLTDGIALEKWGLARESGSRIPDIETAGNAPEAVAMNVSAQMLAVALKPAGAKPRVDCWALANKPVKTAVEVPQRAESLALSPDGKTVAVGYGNGIVAWYDTKTGRVIRHLPPFGRFTVGVVAFHPRGRHLACGTFDKGQANLFLVDMTAGEIVAKMPVDPNGVTAVCFSPAGDRLAAFGASGTVTIWDATKLLKLERD